ncbi:CBS domain-containing protein [archaeon]|jgi:CBS domain-containing protein|nr:CBS domain-containing protein [archaeon]MBT4351028.1 CBS domain-containing protein [archaeon]MBT4647604.1 CBS domain-containing protein [archaeon]MBT6821507.1 CBS domain-containing protein [archaeon]MBT7391241.1 CBS domain-containing protein [archaeon]
METGLKVCDAMTKSPVYVNIDKNAYDCSKIMSLNHVGNLIVMDEGIIKGIVTERDIVFNVIARDKNPKKICVKDIMSKDVVTISPDSDIYAAMVKMKDFSVRRLPVIDSSGLIGILSVKDILRVEPQLFDVISEKFVVWDKPKILDTQNFEGSCEMCGNYSNDLTNKEGSICCPDCS